MSMLDAFMSGDAAESSERQRHAFSRRERQRILREMVMAELRNGSLSAGRRVRLVQFAARLGLNSLEAGSIIKDAREEFGPAGQPARETELQFERHESRNHWPLVQFVCAVAISVAIPLAVWFHYH